VGVHLLVYDHDDMRGALKPDGHGRTARDARPARCWMQESRDE
jgi:hypothetical protein